jgi:hypothetical protein
MALGASAVMVGGVAVVMLNLTTVELAPPDAALDTVTADVPGLARLLFGTIAVNAVADT